jgi:hypothetical protein
MINITPFQRFIIRQLIKIHPLIGIYHYLYLNLKEEEQKQINEYFNINVRPILEQWLRTKNQPKDCRA